MTERFDLLMELADTQESCLVEFGGVVYHARIVECLAGVVKAVARPYGTRMGWKENTWPLSEIGDIDREVEREVDEPEDPLMQQARDFVDRAMEYDGLSLAERLLLERNRGNRGEQHGGDR